MRLKTVVEKADEERGNWNWGNRREGVGGMKIVKTGDRREREDGEGRETDISSYYVHRRNASAIHVGENGEEKI